jgi:hypothetical protein
MTLDGKMSYFTNGATIRQFLKVLLIWVTKTLKYEGWELNTGKKNEMKAQKG